MPTLIENGTVIAWDGDCHRVMEPGVVVFEGNEIVFVGETYDGDVDITIDATGRLVIPGFVNSHLHLTDTPFTKGYQEDVGSPSGPSGYQNYVALYKMLPSVRKASDPEAQYAAALCALAELARTGSTTIVELGYDFEIGGDGDIAITERIAEIIGETGLRCYSGPRFRTRFYGADSKGGVFYEDYPNGARQRFEDCVEFCRSWNGRYDDRLRTMLAPGQIDTCDAQLLKDTRRYADELKIPIQIHAGQSPFEFSRVKQTEHKTNVEYMMETGLLGPDFIIGHGQFMSDGGDVATMAKHEIAALRDSKTTVCHLPWVKARRGGVINSIQKYHDLGIRQSLGTDNYPLDMFNEMLTAAVVCKIVEKSAVAALSQDVFLMATVGGADALGRPDLGRLAPGCKADIVFVRIDTPKAAPVYDPFKFMVLAATGDDVDRVIVDGKTIVDDGKVLTIDVPKAVQQVNEASRRVWGRLDF
ncbi:MAG: amidohydrolase family protein [Proteobacteria bacterium]|nr:amidohydrolase family protein [Pseudomonadota bacterium]